MGLGIVCSVIVLILLVGLGYYVKRAQDKKLERLEEKIETKLVRLEQRLDDLERLPDEQSSE
jgi:prefoldin subunit 5